MEAKQKGTGLKKHEEKNGRNANIWEQCYAQKKTSKEGNN